MTTQKKNSRLSARAILCQILGMLMALTVALPASFAMAADDALHQAAYDGDRAEVKRLLAARADVNVGDDNGWTPLAYAVEIGNLEIIADLLAAGADANVAGNNESLLHHSAWFDYPAVIDILAKNGADVNWQDGDGWTALHWAAKNGRPAAARALVNNGADVNLKENAGATPLHIAAGNDKPVVMDILIVNNANLHSVDERGDTPLHDAVWFGHIDSVDRLIAAGADTTRKNNAGQTPLYYAQREKHNEIADALIVEANENYNFAKKPKAESVSEKVYKKVSKSIVHISSDFGTGSGVIIRTDIVATNCHVVEEGGYVSNEIVVDKAQEGRIRGKGEYPATIRAGDSAQDFCLLDVPGLGGPGAPIKIRLYNTLQVGEDVYAVGNPAGYDLSLSTGIISQLREEGEDGNREIQTDAAISPGSSGGGLFDKDGNLIGITTSGLEAEDGQNVNFAIPADWFFGY